MEITINTEQLFAYGINPSEYVVLCLIYNNELDDVKFNIDKPLKRLKEKGFINENNEITVKNINKLLDKEFKGNKEDLNIYWEEFKSLYPKKDGKRRLHDSPTPCEKKYIKLLKKDLNTHKDVLKGLKEEMRLREEAEKRNEFFQAPKLMSTYINQRAWEAYLENDEEETEVGRDLI